MNTFTYTSGVTFYIGTAPGTKTADVTESSGTYTAPLGTIYLQVGDSPASNDIEFGVSERPRQIIYSGGAGVI